MRRARRVAIAGVAAVAAAVAGTALVVSGFGSAETDPHAPDRGDLRELDAYAAELGLVMARSRGPDPEGFARRVDDPGDDEVQIMKLSGSSFDEGAVVVLKITREHVEPRPRRRGCRRAWPTTSSGR